MKSAYELAMERLKAQEPASKPLTDEQKKELEDIDAKYKAKLAEREIFLKKQLDDALHAGRHDEIESLRKQIADERASIEEDREAAKNRVRNR